MPLLSIQNLVFIHHTLGVLLALPSLAGLGLACVLRGTAAVSGRPATAGVTRHSDAIIILLGGITWLLGSLAFVLGSIGGFASRVLAIAGAAGLATAAACIGTAHGLDLHAPWARLSAALLTTLLLVAALAATLLLRRKTRLLSLAIATMCLLALHTLWVGYTA
jgi:hypothetical protein